ncbi:maleylpyruvate isomerase family mycothiol-dependent enzyme [Streptomyces sp. HC44]|uniref:Maleylpyruvate isomerase family mycothiol-dependent enzyme n=1 Tax=Streptomyces scabichelini TaxID=2711217 RepID=A0A6G4V5Y6_9ACTN|nr:maleylpyruvate isomerase family mycothiol-dependent enzyme [Streptomyces scabichelini]NGO09508.1 maleylpyruvate isomerase family mycothiol-dependent enzyme [Streptomyces scabichelini]
MTTSFGPAIDTRPLFVRERRALLDLLGSLEAEDWERPTVCPGWDVHDVVGHVLNDYMRRLSGIRDGHGGAKFADDETLPAHLARVNGVFVEATRQCSPRLLTELLAHLGPQLDEVWAAARLDAPAGLDVSWASTDEPSPAWLDIAREYTEFWVHQQQIRDAVGRPGADAPDLLGPVIDTFMRALPHTLRTVDRPRGTTVRFDVTGPAGGTWWIARGADRWYPEAPDAPDAPGVEAAAHVSMPQDTLWRLATRGILPEQARRHSALAGDESLTTAATTLLAVVA